MHGAHWRPVSIAYIKGQYIILCSVGFKLFSSDYSHYSGAATTASRLGQPDLAIATLNDFVEVTDLYILTMSCVIPDKYNLCLVGPDGLQPESDDPSYRGRGYWVRRHPLNHRFIITNRS